MRRMFISLVCASIAFVAAGCGASSGSDGDSAKGSTDRVAAIFAGSTTASGWDREGAAAIKEMAGKLDTKPAIVESVAYDKASQTLDRLASQGYEVVIAHSSGFEPAVLEVAPKHPKTQFVLFSDISTTDVPDNVAAWKVNWNELGYLAGTAMCTISSTGIIGHVSSAPIPAFTRMAGGIQQATESEGNCKGKTDPLKIIFTGSFTDAAAAKSAALAVIGKGASVLSDGADAAGEAVVQTAVDKKLPYVGSLVDIGSTAPATVSTSVKIDFASAYAQVGDLIDKDDIKPGGIYPVDVEHGGISAVLPVKNVSNASDVDNALKDAVARIKDGSLKIDATREIKK